MATAKNNENGSSTANGSETTNHSTFINSNTPQSIPTPGFLNQTDRDQIIQLIAQIHDLLPFLRDLTANERRSLLGMGDQNRTFAGKVLEIVHQDPSFLPRSFDIEEFQQNLDTFDNLSRITRVLNQLRDLIDATAIAVGSEAYEGALTAYRYVKASGKGASVESIIDDIGQRFEKKKKKKKDEETPE